MGRSRFFGLMAAGVVVVCGLLVCGCAGLQHKTPEAALDQLEYGMTREEVLAAVGEPNWRGQWPSGDEQWGYYIREYGWFACCLDPYRLRFDSDGRLYYKWDM